MLNFLMKERHFLDIAHACRPTAQVRQTCTTSAIPASLAHTINSSEVCVWCMHVDDLVLNFHHTMSANIYHLCDFDGIVHVTVPFEVLPGALTQYLAPAINKIKTNRHPTPPPEKKKNRTINKDICNIRYCYMLTMSPHFHATKHIALSTELFPDKAQEPPL